MKWKHVNIPGFEHYMVNDEGGVMNVISERELIPYTTRYGYKRLDLRCDGARLQVFAHRLVALAFLPNKDAQLYTEVNHIDKNRANNSLTNLEWCTHQENMLHCYGHIDQCRSFLEWIGVDDMEAMPEEAPF